jgi:hypothetical protein
MQKRKRNHIEVHLLCNTPFRINFLGGWYFVTKIVQTYCEKKIVLVIEKNFEAEGQEFSKTFRSLEQFIQTVKVQNNFL